MANLAQIYDWFMTGKKPTQAQFWASWGSFWNKEETIPQSAISNLTTVLAAKTEKDQFDAHKVAVDAHTDLFIAKEDKDQKGAANGYVPLDATIKIASEYLNIVNDVVTGGATSLASAETVKTLKTQINAINVLLTSDNLNLDTVQEIVDAIETVQTSLSTILVNDLTTGGTTKALTAEMGRTLKGLIDGLTTNKVDKVAGERLITANEITKLSGLTNVLTTVKPILSTLLATQNVAGFVTYINALTAVLTVGANEIVKYNLTDTGRVFQLNLRGRSFGVGQTAIVAADVLEITDFLNKEIRFSNYLNTRNDGANPTNKLLGTDASGNLKLYSMALMPAPFLLVLIPDSTLPSTTTNFVLKGAFFTPTMTVSIVGQTINYITFVSDNEVKVNVTTGAAEGSYAVTLNNGISATFNNALLIVLGTIYKPEITDWINITEPIGFESGKVLTKQYGVIGYAQWNKVLDYTKNFEIRYKPVVSPLGANTSQALTLQIMRVSDNKRMFYNKSAGPYNDLYVDDIYIISAFDFNQTQFQEVKWRYVGGVWTMYYNGVLKHTHSGAFNNLTSNVYLKFGVQGKDMIDIKYIELA